MPGELEIPKVTLGPLEALDYDRPREALPALRLSFDEPGTHSALLVQLGAPAAWSGDGSPAELLAPLVRAAAARARSIAMAEPEPEARIDTTADAVAPPQPARGAKRPRSASSAMPTAAKPPRTSAVPATATTTRAACGPKRPIR